jgi:hypothetical protein
VAIAKEVSRDEYEKAFREFCQDDTMKLENFKGKEYFGYMEVR